MTELQRSVLIVGTDPASFQPLATRLRRASFISDWVGSVGEAMDLIALLPFDAIIVAYPLVDVTVKQFVGVVRRPNAPCRASAVVFLARDEHIEEATRFVGEGVNAVFAFADAADLLVARLRSLIDVAPRFPLRVMSRLRGRLAGTSTLCQTVNISTSGMLLRGDQHVPVGGELHFELTLPGDTKPLRGTGTVVRHTFERRERISGLGIRFAGFEDDGLARLESYLASLG
ncbi:MAG: PilZ domain-containing protein [Thermoanaerobaculaceae bacterium]|nr:PilZ domain-containing protein [Thermoanaerobaculaceae bacterium]MDI9621706.1 PilZ domain-containing protein [Acidobacteriota bacterium]NLH11483.1 PilZ domain-containing protein [Holophagae bacterium]HPW55574.1 PilZ domain-containing protein [Thermoanaerobaculaceae bacterium]